MILDVQFNVDAALAKLEALVAAHGPQAVDVAAHVAQINALNTLAELPGYGLLAGVGAYSARWCFRRADRRDPDGYRDEDQIFWLIPAGLTAVASFFMLGAAVTALFDVWAWVALFNPKLALAHQILAKLTQ